MPILCAMHWTPEDGREGVVRMLNVPRWVAAHLALAAVYIVWLGCGWAKPGEKEDPDAVDEEA